ncbi:MAG: four helix bundle protein [Flavobacteriales bacterium]|nr:four helix bundle protein [Flavobacteriales bacterium]
MGKNVVKDKSYLFAIQIVELYKTLIEKKEFVLSKQLLRSGTAIGALIQESEHAESKKDFIHKLSISLKEANETTYWLNLLVDTNYINKLDFDKINSLNIELIRLLVSIIKSSKNNL